MKNIRFLSIGRIVLGLFVFMAICFLNACSTRNSENAIDTVQPFGISVEEVKVINNQQEIFLNNNIKQTNEQEKRLILSVLIKNVTDKELNDVWFELQLNSEVEPYISSHILKFTSDKMDVTTQANALLADSKDKPIVWGFSHEWDMLLTSEQDLNSYYDLSSEKLVEELKNITVKVHWSGGMQEVTIPLEISEQVITKKADTTALEGNQTEPTASIKLTVSKEPKIVFEDYSELFDGRNGCVVIYDTDKDEYLIYNETMIHTEVSPYSTFKIVATLM